MKQRQTFRQIIERFSSRNWPRGKDDTYPANLRFSRQAMRGALDHLAAYLDSRYERPKRRIRKSGVPDAE